MVSDGDEIGYQWSVNRWVSINSRYSPDDELERMGPSFRTRKLCGSGAVVYWIEPLTLDQRVAGSIPVNAWHVCPSARYLIHLGGEQQCG